MKIILLFKFNSVIKNTHSLEEDVEHMGLISLENNPYYAGSSSMIRLHYCFIKFNTYNNIN